MTPCYSVALFYNRGLGFSDFNYSVFRSLSTSMSFQEPLSSISHYDRVATSSQLLNELRAQTGHDNKTDTITQHLLQVHSAFITCKGSDVKVSKRKMFLLLFRRFLTSISH